MTCFVCLLFDRLWGYFATAIFGRTRFLMNNTFAILQTISIKFCLFLLWITLFSFINSNSFVFFFLWITPFHSYRQFQLVFVYFLIAIKSLKLDVVYMTGILLDVSLHGRNAAWRQFTWQEFYWKTVYWTIVLLKVSLLNSNLACNQFTRQ